ncbi:MAG: GEVED domain-containing protein [Ferruginibacter sp.]
MKKLLLFSCFFVATVFIKTFAQSGCPPINNFTVSNITNTSATFDWVAGPFNYYNTYDFYGIEYKPSNTSTWIWVNAGTPMHQDVSGFSPGTTYDVRVSGQYAFGSCPPAAFLTFTTTGSAPPPVPYCTAKGSSTNYGWIKSVQLGTINNISDNNNGYANFTALSTNVTGNAAIPLIVQAGAKKKPRDQYWNIYVDLNNDGDFFDAGENIATLVTVAGGSSTKNIIIPTNITGPHRMRIRMQYYVYASGGPCGTYSYGEVEDYTVNVTSAASGPIASKLPLASVKETTGSQLKLSVYPNPAANYLIISYIGEQVKSLKVFDISGRMMMEQANLSGNNRLDISKLQKGMYLLQLTTQTGNKTQKFLKE